MGLSPGVVLAIGRLQFARERQESAAARIAGEEVPGSRGRCGRIRPP